MVTLNLGQAVVPPEGQTIGLDPSLEKRFDEIEPYLADGTQTSGISFRDSVLREIIYKQSDLLSTALKLVPSISTADLRHKIEFSGELTGEFPVAEMANAGYERTLIERDFIILKKFEVAFMHTWEQFAHDRAGEVLSHNLRRAAEALAKTIDDRMLETLFQGAATNVASNAAWDDWTNISRNIPLDMAKAESYIFTNSKTQDWEMDNLAIVYPAQCRGAFNSELHDIGGSEMTWGQYLNRVGYSHMPTRQPSLFGGAAAKYSTRDSALVLMKGADTGRFYSYSGHPRIPFVQIDQTRQGISYTIRRWFEGYVIPESESTLTNYRIYRVDNVVA